MGVDTVEIILLIFHIKIVVTSMVLFDFLE